jgi:4-hydroxybenzoate polyprenyltransferase
VAGGITLVNPSTHPDFGPVNQSLSSDMTDIRHGDWVDRRVPPALQPYCRLARLDRPIGTWLLLFPGWWSIALAAPPGGVPSLRLLILFAIGAVVMRGAGCTINDIADRDFDRRVARTSTRPIASGAVTLPRAFAFLVLQLAIGLAVLLQLGTLAVWLGVASLALVVTYPFMKRITYWPQAFLGLTFNWGALLGYAAATGALAPAPILLYAAGIAWTMVYDTIYAHQDKEDDALIGVRSTALKFGRATKPWLALFAALMLVLLTLMIGFAHLGFAAWLALIGVAGHLVWQIVAVDIDLPADCLAKFRANRWIGWILLAGIVLGRALG